MDFAEGFGESSTPAPSLGSFAAYDIKHDVLTRLLQIATQEETSNPLFRNQLEAHLHRLPSSYASDLKLDNVEDVLLHQRLLDEAAKAKDKKPVFNVRLLGGKGPFDELEDIIELPTLGTFNVDSGILSSHERIDVEPCSKFHDLNLEGRNLAEDNTGRQGIPNVAIHEIIFSTIDKPKLLSQLSSVLSDIGLNIHEAHVFSTTDGYSLDVFVVDGWWPVEDTDGLQEAVKKAIARGGRTWSGASHSQSAIEKALAVTEISGDWEIDIRLIKMKNRIAYGSSGYLYRGVYRAQDVAVKVLRSMELNNATEKEFMNEFAVLREVKHENVVSFVGACTKSPNFCIVTEYMTGGSLNDYLKRSSIPLNLPLLVKFAIDVSRGMEYLHQNKIIHRDLKTLNLLLDAHNVVKVADFGVARYENENGEMTPETGTYRWMAPEIIKRKPYDNKADVFSFAIVLWELATTGKVPYPDLTPLEAAIGVAIQGLRPETPANMHPKLLNLMQRCWEHTPSNRPSFTDIRIELEEFLLQL